jgi:hypothetical protein
LLHDDAYLGLTGHQRSVLHGLWLAYASSRCQLRANTASLTRQLALRVTSDTLETLNHAGFITVVASAEQNREELDLKAEKKAREDARAREPAARKTKAGKSKTRELPPDLLEQIARLGGTDPRSPAAVATFVRHGLPEAAFRNALEATHDARAHNRIHGTEIGYFVGTLNQLTDSGQYQ